MGTVIALAALFITIAVSKRGGNPVTQVGLALSNGECTGSGTEQLTHAAMNPADFAFVVPYGLMVGGHVTPIDHQYYAPADPNSLRDAYPVYAVGDAHLVDIEHRVQAVTGGNGRQTDEYRLVFAYSCTFFYYYDLVTSLTPEIEAQFDQHSGGGTNAAVNAPVKAGQLIGRIGGQTLDFAVWNTQKPLTGFITPANYQAEPWKVYTADPLDYYAPDLKSFMLSRYPRAVPPLSGRIDWDIDGKLRGNWFLQGTPGYAGERDNPNGYWVSHLAFAPDSYDESHFVISMGDYEGSGQQFNVKDNSPDPASVGMTSGLIKYELVNDTYEQPNGLSWNQSSLAQNVKLVENSAAPVRGTVLVRLTDARTLKFEAFSGLTGAQVAGFDANAKTYAR